MKTAYINGNVFTVTQGFKEAFVVENEKFIYVGNSDEAKAMADEVIDLNGQFVTCGFNDSHMHLLGFGGTLESMNLATHTSSLEELLAHIKDYIQQNNIQPGQLVKGRGWNHDYFCDVSRFVTRSDLDTVSKDIPIVITRACGHVCVVNTKALEMIGIDENTKPLEGGSFDLEAGLFRENCLDLIYSYTNRVTKEDLKRYLAKASLEVNKYGITSVQTDDFETYSVSYKDVIEVYKELEDEGLMTVKVNEQCQIPTIEELKEFIENDYHHVKYNYYKSGPLKLLGDGSLGARTAHVLGGYEDDNGAKGILCFTQEQLDELTSYANQNGMGCAIHCIGDGMMHMVVDSYRKCVDENNTNRNGIVHCQITDQELLDAFKEMKLIAYVQPIFLDYDINIVESRVGKQKAQKTYAFKTLFDWTHACGGSDCPVELPNVLNAMQCAVTRTTLKGNGPFVASEANTVEEVIRMFTIEGAYASFEEDTKGSIENGKFADFVVLSQNPFEVDPYSISKIQVLETYCNGRQVFKA